MKFSITSDARVLELAKDFFLLMHLILYFFEILIILFRSEDIYVSLIFFVFFDAIMAILNKVRPFNFNKFFF